jgi:hypothetical protein
VLTRELMGLLALGILWVNVLLIAADALRRARALGQLGRTLAGARVSSADELASDRAPGSGGARDVLVSGTITSEGPLALCEIEQTGRVGSSDTETKRSISFHDRRYVGRAPGGTLDVEGRTVRVAEASSADVWVEASELVTRGAMGSPAELDAAYPDAKRGRGFHRTVSVSLERGRRVWAFGSLDASSDRALPTLGTLGPSKATGTLLVATFEPLSFTRAARAKLFGFAFALLAAAAGVTALALVPPTFGPLSTVGAALGLALFLLAQPAGVSVKEAVRDPGKQPLRGAWRVTLSASAAPPSAEREGA